MIAGRVADQLKQLGGTVEILQPTDIYRLDDTPEKIGPAVHAVFKGTGTRKIMSTAQNCLPWSVLTQSTRLTPLASLRPSSTLVFPMQTHQRANSGMIWTRRKVCCFAPPI